MKIGEETVLKHVINACKQAAKYLNRHSHRTQLHTYVYLLVPINDQIGPVEYTTGVKVYRGSENDVLSRYVDLVKQQELDGVIRVTADCPLIQPSVISKMITLGHTAEYDFLSNAMPDFRTYVDGMDCEFISKGMIEWLNQECKGSDREHVTSLLASNSPKWANIGHLFSNVDLSNIKLSVDTQEDLDTIRGHFKSVEKKAELWRKTYGRTVHRFWN